MKKNKLLQTIIRPLISIPIVAALLVVTPAFTHAATTTTHPTTITGSLSTASVQTTKTKPKLSGTLDGAKTLRVKILNQETNKTVYTSKTLKVRNNKWSTTVSKKLPYGTYTVRLYTTEKRKTRIIADETLVISQAEAQQQSSTNTDAVGTVLSISPIPLLAPGQTSAGNTIPIAYLQVQNTGTQTAVLKGFWIKQNGSAPTDAIVGLTTVDDQGGSRGESERSTTLFKNGQAFVPTTTIFTPGYLRLYTIKAIVSDQASKYAGSDLKLDVVSIETDASAKKTFPIRGTTWLLK
jgi:hypothetical protein